jgi:SOS-response transcriptional repressor LexA
MFEFIKGYIASNKQAPTIREIGNYVGYKSVSGAHGALEDLERRGLVKRNRRGAWRDLEITDPPWSMHCPACNKDLPVEKFGLCSARKSGRNLYCKSCIRKTVGAGRDRVRAMKANRKVAQAMLDSVERKAEVMSPMIGTAVSRVRQAVFAGCYTREEIKEATKLPMDSICDALAVLNCDRVIRFQRVEGEARFYPVRAA